MGRFRWNMCPIGTVTVELSFIIFQRDMGDTVEQYRSAIGNYNPSQRQRVSARIRRRSLISEILSIMTLAQIERESRQVFCK